MVAIKIFRILDMNFVIERKGYLFKKYSLNASIPLHDNSSEKMKILEFLSNCQNKPEARERRQYRKNILPAQIQYSNHVLTMSLPIKGKKRTNMLIDLLNKSKKTCEEMQIIC
ncbi:MAG: hypothetical protein PHP54_04345 [Clostridia bacterium]|nr:hypothetical protein [Clostridia bacterium]